MMDMSSLSDLSRTLSLLQGRKESLIDRRKDLERVVGLAKGRLENKTNVEKFFEELQEEITRKNVGSYQVLLDTLNKEVFSDQSSEKREIVLDLSVERGLPSLDILVESDGVKDEREDVLEDNGGALTNIMSVGLRMIAIVKSKSRKFLVLDEPDCWIEPKRVEKFYHILNQMADRLKLQCFMISHHDTLKFGKDIYSAHLDGMPKKGGVKIIPDCDIPVWSEDQPGFRWIRLVNIQGYVDVTIPMSPKVMIITGPNGRGKSTLTRAWRAVFYGESRDGLIRHGNKVGIVEIGLENNRFLRWSRAKKRNPVNLWSLHEQDGTIVEENGVKYETGGKNVPSWVDEMFRLPKIENLDVHISHQKFPIFLMGETPSKRASVLSIGQEASYMNDMQALYKERCQKDMISVREGEKELVSILNTLDKLSMLDELVQRYAELELLRVRIEDNEKLCARLGSKETQLDTLLNSISELSQKNKLLSKLYDLVDIDVIRDSIAVVKEMSSTVQKIEMSERDLESNRKKDFLFNSLPMAEPNVASTEKLKSIGLLIVKSRDDLDNLVSKSSLLSTLPVFPEIVSTEHLKSIGIKIKNSLVEIDRSIKKHDLLKFVPLVEPVLVSGNDIESICRSIVTTNISLEGEITKLNSINNELDRIKTDISHMLEESGGLCMTCGQPVGDVEMLLEGHRSHDH